MLHITLPLTKTGIGMALKAPTIVIFDMDGTTVRHLSPFVLAMAEGYDDLNYKVSKFFNWIFKKKAQGPIITAEEETRRKRRRPRLPVHRTIHWLRRNKEVDQIVEPCPGIYDVLELLQDRGIPMAMVSNGLGKGYGHDIIERFGLAPFFKVTLFREDINKSKPNPEPILSAIKQLEIEIKEDDVIWYVGDRRKDVIAAMAARGSVPCALEPVAYAMNAAAATVEVGLTPDHIMMDYGLMARFLEKSLQEPKGGSDGTNGKKKVVNKDEAGSHNVKRAAE